jgi:hypothetical protein
LLGFGSSWEDNGVTELEASISSHHVALAHFLRVQIIRLGFNLAKKPRMLAKEDTWIGSPTASANCTVGPSFHANYYYNKEKLSTVL